MQKKNKEAVCKYDIYQLSKVGEDVFISANVEIRRPHLVYIGSHIAIDTGLYCTTALEMGDYIHIGPYVSIIGGERGLLKLGNFTNIAVGSRLICVSDTYSGRGLITAPGIPPEFCELKIEPIVFNDFVNVGANVVILPGVTLGEGTVVGACSLVNKDTEPWTVYIGTPARPVKKRPNKYMLEYAGKLGY